MVNKIVNQNSHFKLKVGIIIFILLAVTGTILGLWKISGENKSKVFIKNTKSSHIHADFRKKVELYYADKLKTKKYHGNVVSVNGVCFPADLSTQHQKLQIFSSEHID